MRLVILLLFVLISLNLVSAPMSGESEVDVIIDGDAPSIIILSPGPINYRNNTPILANYNVFDQTHDSTWYWLNNGINASINSSFYLSLAEGNYVLRIYANDSLSRINFSEVSFTVNNSLPACSDSICSANENCNSCQQDCGQCSPTQTNGETGETNGGGGKLAARKTAEEDIINIEILRPETIGEEVPPEFRVIILGDEVEFVDLDSGEKIALDVPNKEVLYIISFGINNGEASLIVLGDSYNFPKGKIIRVLLDNVEVFMALTELEADNLVVAMSLDENAIRNLFVKFKRANYVLVGIILVLAVVTSILVVWYFRKRNSYT